MRPFAQVATSSYHSGVRSVGIKTLKNRLSEYVRMAEAGETVLITDRDRVIAQLGPAPSQRDHLRDDPVLAELVSRGILTPAARPLAGAAPRGQPVCSLAQLLGALDADRSDRAGEDE